MLELETKRLIETDRGFVLLPDMQINRGEPVFGVGEVDNVLEQMLGQPFATLLRVDDDAFHIAYTIGQFGRGKHQFGFSDRDARDLCQKDQRVRVGRGIDGAEVLLHCPVNIACGRSAKTIEFFNLLNIFCRRDTNNQRRCWWLLSHNRYPANLKERKKKVVLWLFFAGEHQERNKGVACATQDEQRIDDLLTVFDRPG